MKDRIHMVGAAVVVALIAIGAAPPPPAAQHESMVQRQAEMMGRMMPGARSTGEIARLTEEMNTTTGEARIDAMARLLTVLATQHSMMLDHMAMMRGDAARHPSAPAETPHSGH